jgi:outer membrane scaffolding protein for murein synthesis (MipA/OmpV family)
VAALFQRPDRPVRRWVAVLACGASLGAHAAEPVLDTSRDYLLGLGLVSSANHLGEARQSLRLRPLWAFQLGRFRVATSGASALLSVGRQTVDPGLSTDVFSIPGLRLSTSLRYDEKRSWDGDARLQGLPDVRATLRGRATVSGDLGERWSWSVSGSQDLLGRDGGLRVSTGLGYRHPVSEQTHWDLSLGVGWGNALYRNTHYGIADVAAASTGRTPYALGNGWDSVSLGWQLTTALSRRWVAYGGLNVSQLQGAAARSPLVGQRTVYGATVGVAYRN